MAANGLMVVGSRPPSRLDSRCGSALSTRRHTGGTYDLETPKTPPSFSKFRNTSYEDELFGRINAVVAGNADYKQFDGQARSNKNASTKELSPETLPPSRRQEDAFLTFDRPPSCINRTRTQRNDSKAKNTQTSRKGTSRHTLQSTHTPSYVDETLFGSTPDAASFPAPWDKRSDRKPPVLIFDCTDYRNKQNRADNATDHSSEQGHRLGSRPTSAKPKYKPPTVVHRQSYVDETLFGDRPFEAEWPAPWEKKEDARKKPLLFDAFDYKVTVKHKDTNPLGATNKRDAQAKRIGCNGHPHVQ